MKRKINTEQDLDQLVHIIVDSLPANCNATMTQKFSELVESINSEKNIDPLISEEEKKLIEKIELLKIAESNGDLAWMDYGSWNRFSELLQTKFDQIIEPLFYDGIFFVYSKFVGNNSILEFLDDRVVIYVVKYPKSFRFYCIDILDTGYHWMNNRVFNRMESDISSGTIRTYRRESGSKSVVINIIRGEGDNARETSPDQ